MTWKKRLVNLFTTILELAGVAAITYGCWLVTPWLGLIVGGALLIALSFFISARRSR